MHIVSGPHYAKDRWLSHPQTILLDSAHYRFEKSGKWVSTDFVSLGWMNRQGGRDFVEGVGRQVPEIKNNATGDKSIFLADYDGPIEDADTIRLHPAREKPTKSLLNSLHEHRTAIGYNTTALVMAALEGLEIDCRSEQSIMSKPNWRQLLPYIDWKYSDIESGDAWAHLISSLNQLSSL